MLVPDAVAEVYITHQLHLRTAGSIDPVQEKLAVQDIARQMAGNPSQVLPTLVDLAIELCGAVAGGISIYERETEVFRWHHLRGTLERFTGATTPRNYSPCGITLDHRSAVLVQKPERAYSWLVDAAVSLPECLLVPLFVGDQEPLGTLWIVSEDVEHFTDAHAKTLHDLAGFTGIALLMIQAENRLKAALVQQELLTGEMAHRVKNLFAIANGMIRMSAKSSTSKDDLAESLSGRFNALASANALVRRNFSSEGHSSNASSLSEIIAAVLKPYAHAGVTLNGPDVPVGERATNTIALVFHEMATNAAKYGALSADIGTINVEWNIKDSQLDVAWTEFGGPPITSPPHASGFGSALVDNTVKGSGGSIAYSWLRDGVKIAIMLPLEGLAD